MTTMLNREELVDLVRRGKRAKERGAAVRRVVTRLLAASMITLIGGWELMLAVGLAHAEWVPALPTIGYWWAVLLILLLRGTFSATRPVASRNKPQEV